MLKQKPRQENHQEGSRQSGGNKARKYSEEAFTASQLKLHELSVFLSIPAEMKQKTAKCKFARVLILSNAHRLTSCPDVSTLKRGLFLIKMSYFIYNYFNLLRMILCNLVSFFLYKWYYLAKHDLTRKDKME
jgi:hypothetical protein